MSTSSSEEGTKVAAPPAVVLVLEQVGNSFALLGAAQRRDLASLTVSLLRSHASDSLFHKDDFDGQLTVGGGGRGNDIPPLPEEHGAAREERSVLIMHGGDGILLGELGKRVVAGAEIGASRKRFS